MSLGNYEVGEATSYVENDDDDAQDPESDTGDEDLTNRTPTSDLAGRFRAASADPGTAGGGSGGQSSGGVQAGTSPDPESFTITGSNDDRGIATVSADNPGNTSPDGPQDADTGGGGGSNSGGPTNPTTDGPVRWLNRTNAPQPEPTSGRSQTTIVPIPTSTGGGGDGPSIAGLGILAAVGLAAVALLR